ncbi:replication restart DNA helicase PriA [Dethiosulfovibrio salsuginis]|uniref:Replication restart DNA helicase PriA n=1 Tax=Dethiosulfovibrio salsuginis TaxID=561720 RepID=A0A1X7IAC3_9BACT|nr:replication restart DNA helicase PriA [Dethiosulfovibrio salsuginis]
MSCFVDVVVPGPWWGSLSYRSDELLIPGCRVSVPVGRTKRVGFVLSSSSSSSWPEGKVRAISSVIDGEPVLPPYLWRLISWAGRAFLCGQGQALMAMLPKELLSGEKVPAFKSISQGGGPEIDGPEVLSCYRWRDIDRSDFYLSMIQSCRAIVAFPEQSRAESFFRSAVKAGLDGGMLWPVTGGAKKLNAWISARDGECRFIVGGPGVMAAPFEPDRVIIEDEGSEGYRSLRSPRLNGRSVLSRMAKEVGAKLILGGRVPSSRVFKGISPDEERVRPGKRLIFIDVKEGHTLDIPGASRDIPLAQGTMERTIRDISKGKVVLWILDRKGYVGDLRCDDCGAPLACPCGGSFRLEGGRMSCFRCGRKASVPDTCPDCGGPMITGQNPGIEALMPSAKSMVPDRPVVVWSADEPKGKIAKRDMIKSLSSGGLVLGTRKALELCDYLDVPLICWLDGDGEARRPDHGARHSAYSMVVESCWRGNNPEDRQVILQSRRAGKGWQMALNSGWTVFWNRELEERRDVELPPFRYLAEISCLGGDKDRVSDSLSSAGGDVMDPDPSGDLIWVAFTHILPIYRALERFFSIGSRSYPKVVLWTD